MSSEPRLRVNPFFTRLSDTLTMKENIVTLLIPALAVAAIASVGVFAFSGSYMLAIGAVFAGSNLTVLAIGLLLALSDRAEQR